MSERDTLLASIAHTVRDYRSGVLDPPTPDHVADWIRQFAPAVQLSMLREMDHVLKKTYFSRARVTEFLQNILQEKGLVGTDPRGFWRGASFLDIQNEGNSQKWMLELFNEILQQSYGFGVTQCGGEGSSIFVYLDDAIFTGNRVRSDLQAWIRDKAPNQAVLYIVSIALHSGGSYFAQRNIGQAAVSAGKRVYVRWHSGIEMEDRNKYCDMADVLRPTIIPEDPSVQEYVRAMKQPPVLRSPGNIGRNGLFSGDEGKHLLEQQLLRAGVEIRRLSPNPRATMRPLGHSGLDTLGFGSLIVTFRNCPNNAPLALWADGSWYPLFPRATNKMAAMNRLLEYPPKGES